jgi:CDP-paratose 2-epimerase
VCSYFAALGWQVFGLDNNQRAVFFGDAGDTRWNQRRLQEQLGESCVHQELDIRDRAGVLAMMEDMYLVFQTEVTIGEIRTFQHQ